MSLRLLAASVAVLGAFAALPAAADEAAANGPVIGTVNIDASVAPKCLFTGENPVQLSLGELADATGKLDTSKVDSHAVTLHAWCNAGGSTMHVETTKLSLNPPISPLPDGFVQQVDYTANAVANGKTATDDTSVDGPGADVLVGIFTGDVPVTLLYSHATGLLIAGAYQGTVIVTLTPGAVAQGPAS